MSRRVNLPVPLLAVLVLVVAAAVGGAAFAVARSTSSDQAVLEREKRTAEFSAARTAERRAYAAAYRKGERAGLRAGREAGARAREQRQREAEEAARRAVRECGELNENIFNITAREMDCPTARSVVRAYFANCQGGTCVVEGMTCQTVAEAYEYGQIRCTDGGRAVRFETGA